VGELRQAKNDISDGVDAGLGGLLGLVDLDESAIGFDLGGFEIDAGGAWLTARKASCSLLALLMAGRALRTS
jgi:hypothetical protein